MFTVAALYKFTPFEEPDALKKPLAQLACRNGVRGTLLLAREGINGTIAGSRAGIDAVLDHIQSLPGCRDIEWKESSAEEQPFKKLKVRLKREIVTMGQPDVDPTAAVGTYVSPQNWNALIVRDDVVTVDTRNDYEVGIGTFEGAVDPETRDFREFPEWWRANSSRFEGKKIAMFCTGGIRCEKATNFLLSEGVEDVFHLRGGILKYLEEVPEDQSTWSGECFVFDRRVSLGHGLREGDYGLCFACRRPISDADRGRPEFEDGVACHQCVDEYTDTDRARFRERQRQIMLARTRGEDHLGD